MDNIYFLKLRLFNFEQLAIDSGQFDQAVLKHSTLTLVKKIQYIPRFIAENSALKIAGL